MRTIKFRAYYPELGMSRSVALTVSDIRLTFDDCHSYYTLGSLPHGTIFIQFTGLLDKNDVEIYEGDVMRRGSGIAEQVGPVVFDRGCFFMEAIGAIPWPNGNSPTWVRFVLAAYESEIEVIGNIHENPELLE